MLYHTPDQTGLMPGRHMYFHLHCLFNILYDKHSGEAVVISLNAQHAFDQVEWFEIIYSQPTASVMTYQNISPPFAVHRGTRKGCPLSPFLFAVIIEPLAASIRQSPLISPIDMFGYKHYLSLYADNILLYISQPQVSILEFRFSA